MKKIYLLTLTTFFVALGTFFIACSSNEDNPSTPITPEADNGVTALANLNPDEPIIVDISNDQGLSVVMMGTKDETGQPEKLEQMIITVPEEENPTEVFLDENEKIKEMFAPNGVRFQFEWLSDTEATITLIDPDTNEQLNTVIDFANKDNPSQSAATRSASEISRSGATTLSIEPIKNTNVNSIHTAPKALTRAGGDITGDVYLEQCGSPATAQCWVDVYDYSDLTGAYGRGKYRGRFACTKVGDGHYQFKLPKGYNAHHNIADYCDGINNIIGTVCGINAWTAPGTGAKQFLCLQISAYIASGIVTAPVAAKFLVACEVTTAALDEACSLINGNMYLPEGTPTLVDGACGWLREMNLTWDTPLFLVPVVNALPSCIYGTTQKYEAGGELKPMYITWGGHPVINSFTLNPPKPARRVSYQAIADLVCLPVGTKVTMDIIGTDGYTNSQTSTVGTGENISYRATLGVPGAESGVKDVCTVTVVTPSGETVSKKASLVFQ